MPNAQQGFSPKDVDLTYSQNVRMTNLSVSTSETSHALISGLRQLMIRSRTLGARLQLAFVSGESTTNYITLEPACVYEITDLKFNGQTLYITSSESATVEIQELY